MARKQQEINYETKVEILKAYQNREIKAHEIPKMFGISQSVMQKVVLELGGRCESLTRQVKEAIVGNFVPSADEKLKSRARGFARSARLICVMKTKYWQKRLNNLNRCLMSYRQPKEISLCRPYARSVPHY